MSTRTPTLLQSILAGVALFAETVVAAGAPGRGVEAQEGAAADCVAPMKEPITHLVLPGNPFQPVSSADGCYIFVSIPRGDSGAPSGVAVVRRSRGAVSLIRMVPTESAPMGMVLTHDGKLLIAAAGGSIIVLDVARMIAGANDVVRGALNVESTGGAVYANVTKDDRFLFVRTRGSGEDGEQTTVDGRRKTVDG